MTGPHVGMKASEARTHMLPDPPAHWETVEERQDGAAYRHRLNPTWTVIVSAAKEQDGRVWVHLSTAHRDRMPTWSELVQVKREFLGGDRKAIQVLPPDSEYVNQHPYCLHLFVCMGPEDPPARLHGGRADAVKGFTKTGEPRQGSKHVFRLEDGSREVGKIVGKGWGQGRDRPLILISVEWDDGTRQTCPWPDVAEAMEPGL